MYCSPKTLLLGAWRVKSALALAVVRGLWVACRALAIPLSFVCPLCLTLGLPRLPGASLRVLPDGLFPYALAGLLAAAAVQGFHLVTLVQYRRQYRDLSALSVVNLCLFAFMLPFSLFFWASAQYGAALPQGAAWAIWFPQLSLGWNLALLPVTVLMGMAALAGVGVVVGFVALVGYPLVRAGFRKSLQGIQKLCQAGQPVPPAGA